MHMSMQQEWFPYYMGPLKLEWNTKYYFEGEKKIIINAYGKNI